MKLSKVSELKIQQFRGTLKLQHKQITHTVLEKMEQYIAGLGMLQSMVHDNGLESVSRQFRTSTGDIGSSIFTRQSRLRPHVDKEEWLLAPLEVSCAGEDKDEPMPPRLRGGPQRCIEECGHSDRAEKPPKNYVTVGVILRC